MYVGIDRPLSANWTLVNADWVGDSNGSQLMNGQPRDVTRLQVAPGDIGGVTAIELRATWSTAVVPRIGCILGLQLPPGVPLTITGMRATTPGVWGLDLGGNSQIQRTVRMADGSVGAWWMFAADVPACIGLSIVLAGEGDLQPFLPGAFVDIGEVGFWRGALFGGLGISRGWKDGNQEPITQRALNNTPWPESRIPGRTLEFSAQNLREQHVYGNGGDAAINLAQLRNRALSGETIAAVPRWRLPYAVDVDPDTLNAHALIGGFGRFDAITHQAGRIYSTACRIDEYGAYPAV